MILYDRVLRDEWNLFWRWAARRRPMVRCLHLFVVGFTLSFWSVAQHGDGENDWARWCRRAVLATILGRGGGGRWGVREQKRNGKSQRGRNPGRRKTTRPAERGERGHMPRCTRVRRAPHVDRGSVLYRGAYVRHSHVPCRVTRGPPEFT